MRYDDLARARRALLAGASFEEVCEDLGCSRRTLDRAFERELGISPAAWRRAMGGPRPSAPDVAFRLTGPEREALQKRAETLGRSVGTVARDMVLEALGLPARES